jgi:hypothetical protein
VHEWTNESGGNETRMILRVFFAKRNDPQAKVQEDETITH